MKASPVNWLPRPVLKIFGLPLVNSLEKTLPVFNVDHGFLNEATVPKNRASEKVRGQSVETGLIIKAPAFLGASY